APVIAGQLVPDRAAEAVSAVVHPYTAGAVFHFSGVRRLGHGDLRQPAEQPGAGQGPGGATGPGAGAGAGSDFVVLSFAAFCGSIAAGGAGPPAREPQGNVAVRAGDCAARAADAA